MRDALWGAYEGTKEWFKSIGQKVSGWFGGGDSGGLFGGSMDESQDVYFHINPGADSRAEGMVNTSFLGRMGERFSSLFSFNGFDTKAENVLENILQPGTSDKPLTVTLADGSIIHKAAGQEGVTLKLYNTDGKQVDISLRGSGELSKLLNGSSSFFGALGNINDQKSGLQWHSDNLREYYSQFRYGADVVGMNGYKDKYYNFENTLQALKSDPEMQRRIAAGEINEKAFTGYPGYFSGELSDQMNCIFSSKINMLKSEGLIRPDVSVYDVYDNMGKTSGLRSPVDSQILQSAMSSDWAKLTGADQFSYRFVRLGSTSSVVSAPVTASAPEQLPRRFYS